MKTKFRMLICNQNCLLYLVIMTVNINYVTLTYEVLQCLIICFIQYIYIQVSICKIDKFMTFGKYVKQKKIILVKCLSTFTKQMTLSCKAHLYHITVFIWPLLYPTLELPTYTHGSGDDTPTSATISRIHTHTWNKRYSGL